MQRKQQISVFVFSLVVMATVLPPVVQAQRVQRDVATLMHPTKATASSTLIRQAVSDFHQTIVNEREEMKQQMQQAQNEFQQKLSLIKDQKKQQRVISINDHIQSLNQTETDKMSQALDSLSTILEKIESQRDILVSKDANVTILNTDITTATKAITTAKGEVSTQASKTYSISIVSDATLKTTVGTTVSQFRADMTTTYKSVVNAKQAVVKAAQELKTVSATLNSSASPSAAVRE